MSLSNGAGWLLGIVFLLKSNLWPLIAFCARPTSGYDYIFRERSLEWE